MRSACALVATMSPAVALLFAWFGSLIAELTVTLSLIAVPGAAAPATVTTKVMVAGVLGARDVSVHVSVTRLHVQPAGPVSDDAVVNAGRASVRVTLVAVLGPALLTTCV